MNVLQSIKQNNGSLLSTAVLIISAPFFLFDIYEDYFVEKEGIEGTLFEGTVFLLIVLTLGFELYKALRYREDLQAKHLIIESLTGQLQKVILAQFAEWGLTRAEQDVALMLIKGYSMQEAGELKNISEKTIRQHATKIYAKSSCKNRSELTAFFIENLLKGIEIER